MKKFNSMQVKLPVILNIATVVISLFIIVSLINLASSEIDNYANQYMISTVDGCNSYLDISIENQILLMESYASMPVMLDYIQNGNRNVFTTLTQMLDNNKYITNAYILSRNSEILASYTGDTNIGGRISEIYPDLWNIFKQENKVSISETIYESDMNNGFILPIIVPILDNKVFLEDLLLDFSIFNVSQLKIETIRPECLFIDCFGFSSLRINNEVFNFNVLIEKLKKNDAEEILMYLWKKNKGLYNAFLSKSSTAALNIQEAEISMTSKFINYANSFYDKMLEYSTSFKSLPYYVLRPKRELANYSASLIDADSIPWILENLDTISFSPEFRYDPDAIDFDGKYGIIDRLYVNRQTCC